LLALVESQLILKSLTLAPTDEIYVLDATTLNLLYASDEAQKRIGNDELMIQPEQLEAILGVSSKTLVTYVNQQRDKKSTVRIERQSAAA